MRKLLRVLFIVTFAIAVIGAAAHVHERSTLSPLQATCALCLVSAAPAMPGVAPVIPLPQVSEPYAEPLFSVAVVYSAHILDNSPNRSPPA